LLINEVFDHQCKNATACWSVRQMFVLTSFRMIVRVNRMAMAFSFDTMLELYSKANSCSNFETVRNSENKQENMFFINGPSGIGKTYFYDAVLKVFTQ
jgi:chromosomal replication initiation ATPase DnaA